MTRLEAMRPASFAAFFEAAVGAYADENVRAGRWLQADALQLARDETNTLLPAGLATPGHQLFEIHDEAGEVPGPAAAADDTRPDAVGFLWMATLQRGHARTAYVYQLVVDPAHRRRGHAGRALRQAGALAAAQGHAAIALHVFGHNLAAQALYRSLGFEVTSLTMAMPLAPSNRPQAESPAAGVPS